MQPAEVLTFIDILTQTNLGYLGLAVTILTLFGGASYLFNFKPLKEEAIKQGEELRKLNDEVSKNLSSARRELKGQLTQFKKEMQKAVVAYQKSEGKELLADVRAMLAESELPLLEKAEYLAEEKDEKRAELTEAQLGGLISDIEKKIAETANELRSKLVDSENAILGIHTSIKELTRKTRELEVYKYSQKGQMGAVIGLIELLSEDINDNTWRIEDRLVELQEELKDVTVMRPYVVTLLEEQLARLDSIPKYGPLVKKLREKYQAA